VLIALAYSGLPQSSRGCRRKRYQLSEVVEWQINISTSLFGSEARICYRSGYCRLQTRLKHFENRLRDQRTTSDIVTQHSAEGRKKIGGSGWKSLQR
jgi:hypothetical protein